MIYSERKILKSPIIELRIVVKNVIIMNVEETEENS